MAKTTTRTPVYNLDLRRIFEHRNAILLEEIKGQMKLVLETVDTSISGVKQELSEFRCETNQRFDRIESVVRGHSTAIAELKTDMTAVKADTTSIKADMASMEQSLRSEIRAFETRLSGKIDGIGRSVDNHEVRIAAIERAS